MLSQAWMVLFHLQVDLSLEVISKWASRELKIPWRLQPYFKCECFEWAWTIELAPLSPKGKFVGSHMVGHKYWIHMDTPLHNIIHIHNNVI